MENDPTRSTPDPERPGSSQGRLRELNLVMLLPMVAVGGVLAVAVDARSWGDAVVLGLGVVAALVAFVYWASGDILRVAVPCLLVSAAVWAFGALVADSASAFFGLTVVGPFVVAQLPRRRAAAAVGLAVYVAAVGSAGLVAEQRVGSSDLVGYLIVPTGVVVITTALMFPNKRFRDVLIDLEESRERDAELAVVRERIRFASDLHDIQGHTLHVVKLKIALAQKLLHTDPERVEQELHEMYVLVGDTITQTKELAHAQRRLNLSAELENAKNLFEAAGIHVRVDRDAEIASGANELLGQVLRETTTNILRHAQATQVRITLSGHGISIVNDGVRDDVLPELRGLSTLRHRVADDGGELTVRLVDGRFLTAATFPTPRAEPTAPSREGHP